tara:strand:- start:121 stop:324 length:204 start_codon:yes stop_codon:yes gene_type:complete
VAEDKSLQLDLETLPTKYIALCEFTAVLMGDGATAKDIDKQVEMFIRLTSFEASEEELPEVEVHLNG